MIPNQAGGARSLTDPNPETIVVPVIREDWQLHKETHETGTLRVQTLVHDREESINDSLTADTVDVQRIPMNQVVEAAPGVRTEDGVVVISVVEEFAIVPKQLRVVEEIRITRRKTLIPMQEKVSLRAQEVTVQRLPVGQTGMKGETGGETMDFSETLETAYVTKEARVVEEVSISKDVNERTEVITDTVRHTEVEVEKISDAAAASSASGQ